MKKGTRLRLLPKWHRGTGPTIYCTCRAKCNTKLHWRVLSAWLLAVSAAVGATVPVPLPGPGSVSRRDTSSIVHACTRSTVDSRSPARFCYLHLFGLLLYRKAHRQNAKQLQLPNKARRLQRADQRSSRPSAICYLLACYSIPARPVPDFSEVQCKIRDGAHLHTNIYNLYIYYRIFDV
jgi:hypothetical protein